MPAQLKAEPGLTNYVLPLKPDFVACFTFFREY